MEQYIFASEVQRAGFPLPTLTLETVGPTIMRYGNERQKAELVPKILAGEMLIAIGYSEPNAGTDLASLVTRAERDGDEWVVTGQKVWTTAAHHAKWCMLLARTDRDAPKHKGLTYFILDMEQEGVEVRPLRQITGESEFNEVFLDEVEVPVENLIGPENDGWGVANTTLRLKPRRVSDTPRSALAANAAVTPGTISKSTPAAANASISSCARPKIIGSPPLRRTTVS